MPDETNMRTASGEIGGRKPKPENAVAIVDLFKRAPVASAVERAAATGWQAHPVRGALSGAMRKALGGPVSSTDVDGVHRYFCGPAAAASVEANLALPSRAAKRARPGSPGLVASASGASS